jgi:serine/threonine-protein kinase
VPAEAARRELARLLASPVFTQSERMSRFLRLIVEYRLEGRADELKEYLLGTQVFDRPADYDSRLDPIVRVEARRLRNKLKSYYQSEGLHDDIEIEVPTGGYAPVFRRRASAPARAPGSLSGIAVLPFSNLSSEPDNEYFSDGLTEELIHRLTKVEGLRVVAWNSAARFRRGERDLTSAAEHLRAGAVLSGSVRRSGGRLRIAAQLIETATGTYVWSETYDRELRDLFAVQEEIARAIIDALRLRFSGGHVRPAPNLEAYNLYLKGRYHWNRRSPEGLRKSVEYYRQALEIEPQMAICYAGLADGYVLLADYGLARPDESIATARAAAERAIALDPLLGEAHASLALIRSTRDWEWADAGRHYARSIELNPGYATARHWHAVDYFAPLGRHAEAASEIEMAIRLDPLSPIILEGKGLLHTLARNYEEAIRVYREVLELEPGFLKALSALGRASIQLGRFEEAIEFLGRAHQQCGDLPNVAAALGQAYALAGNRAQARAVLAQLASMAERHYVPTTSFAVVHLGLGEREQALEWLERGLERRDLPMTALKVHPVYDSLRSHPRFQALVAAVFGAA